MKTLILIFLLTASVFAQSNLILLSEDSDGYTFTPLTSPGVASEGQVILSGTTTRTLVNDFTGTYNDPTEMLYYWLSGDSAATVDSVSGITTTITNPVEDTL